MSSFSERQGYDLPKAIRFRDELPEELRIPIYDILRRNLSPAFLLELAESILNPYGIDQLPRYTGALSVSKEEDIPQLIAFKRLFLGCEWFRIYDIIEDAFKHLDFYEEEFADREEEQPRAYPMQAALNLYFLHAGIGWRMVEGKIVTRGDDAFENTIHTSDALSEHRPTAAQRLHTAIESLSKRPKPDTAGAVSDAISAIECVLTDVTGVKAGQNASLSEFIKDQRFFPGSLKKAMEGLWGYASNQGARHGKEGVEPVFVEAQFVVAVCAAISTLLNATHPKS